MNHSHHHDHAHHNVVEPLPANDTGLETLPPPNLEDHHSHHHHHQEHSTSHEGHFMKMWFHGGANETVLFEWWKIETYWGLLFSCIAIFLMGVAYEAIKWFRVYLHNLQITSEQRTSNHSPQKLSDIRSQAEDVLLNKVEVPSDGTATLRSDEVYKSTVTRENNRAQKCRLEKFLRRMDIGNPSPISAFRILQTSLYALQLTLAYWLMLVAMTYNTYLTLAVVLGCGFGHWIFAISKFVKFHDHSAGTFASDVCH